MHDDNPFGNPDGARADIKEIETTFITDNYYGASFTTKQASLLNKRVIVGAKGSGKTVYLRKIKSILNEKARNQETGIYVDSDIDQNLNCTEKVISIGDICTKKLLSEKWTQIWKTAIYISTCLKFIHDERLSKDYISLDEKKELTNLLESTNLYFKFPLTVYEAFIVLLQNINTANDLNEHIDSFSWISIKKILKKILRNSPTIYMFLDSIDIEYEHAPMYWLFCQKGLFYAVMAFLQEEVFGEKLHIIMSMRSNVFSSVLRSEHNTKFVNEDHIFYLNWNYNNIKYFLAKKIELLKDCYFLDDYNKYGKTITTWLGFDKIKNEKRNKIEDLMHYILRHTRLVPRDVIILCNSLSEIKRKYGQDKAIDIQVEIRKIVHHKAKSFGEELITICAKNIVATQIPEGSGIYDYSSAFTANEAYQKGSYDKLKSTMVSLKSDRIKFSDLKILNQRANEEFKTEVDLIDILWQNSVICYVDDNNVCQYYTQNSNTDNFIPDDKNFYFIRSCLIDALSLEKVHSDSERFE